MWRPAPTARQERAVLWSPLARCSKDADNLVTSHVFSDLTLLKLLNAAFHLVVVTVRCHQNDNFFGTNQKDKTTVISHDYYTTLPRHILISAIVKGQRGNSGAEETTTIRL